MTHQEFSRKGGKAISDKKKASGKLNIEKAREAKRVSREARLIVLAAENRLLSGQG
jgi:hypothetical protein